MKVLIVGCGNIGFRHLEGILRVSGIIKIYIYDLDFSSFESKRNQISEESLKKIVLCDNLNNIENELDFIICATGSNERFEIISNLLSTFSCKNYLVEKIPFNSIDELQRANELFFANKINVWVNCPRRTLSIYKNLKNQLNQDPFTFHISGSNWGLACNALHFLDLMSFFTNSSIRKLSFVDATTPFQAKRKGYFEIDGTILIEFENGTKGEISCNKDTNLDLTLTINQNSTIYTVNESKTKFYTKNEVSDFKFPFASDLTEILLNLFLTTPTKIELPTLANQLGINLKFLECMTEEFKKYKLVKNSKCPIT